MKVIKKIGERIQYYGSRLFSPSWIMTIGVLFIMENLQRIPKIIKRN